MDGAGGRIGGAGGRMGGAGWRMGGLNGGWVGIEGWWEGLDRRWEGLDPNDDEVMGKTPPGPSILRGEFSFILMNSLPPPICS